MQWYGLSGGHECGESVVRGIRVCVLAVVLIVCAQAAAFGQEFSERREVAIFRLSYYGQPVTVPRESVKVRISGPRTSLTVELRGSGDPRVDDLFIRALGAVDERVRSTFINLGRFDVIGMDQRLTARSVDDFIAILTDFKRSQAELPEAVLLGQQAFTETDFQRLVGGFVVVVPSVSWYSLNTTDDGSYRAEIETSFTFINIEDLRTTAQFFVTTTGTDPSADAAVHDAVMAISSELDFRLREMPEFQIRTGILEVDGDEVILEFGRNMGLQPGDEYAIVSERVLSTGHIAVTETGLLLIKDVQAEFSTGHVFYASPRPMMGDQLQEVPRRGVEVSGYLDTLTNGAGGMTYAAGARAVASRGFYNLRPLIAVEVPLRGVLIVDPALANVLVPVNAMVGGEFNIYLGRIAVTPALAVGAGGLVPLGAADDLQSFYLSHLGGQLRVTGSILVTRDIRIFVETGVGAWLGLQSDPATGLGDVFGSYGGLLIGGGITFK